LTSLGSDLARRGGRLRRVLRERRIGHTGTLDPLATGVLPLVVGAATRLARFLSASDKALRGGDRLGHATDTATAWGRRSLARDPVNRRRSRAMPSNERSRNSAAPTCSSRGVFSQEDR
jgi:hypothetical protein